MGPEGPRLPIENLFENLLVRCEKGGPGLETMKTFVLGNQMMTPALASAQGAPSVEIMETFVSGRQMIPLI